MALALRRPALISRARPYEEIIKPYPQALIADFAGLRNRGVPWLYKNGLVSRDLKGVPGASYTRTGELLYQDKAGIWRVAAANDDGNSDAGLPVYEGGSPLNKCTNYNAAPLGAIALTDEATFNANPNRGNVQAGGGVSGALYGIVDDTLNLMAAGFGRLIAEGRMSGLVLVIVNTAGAATANFSISGNPGNTNQHYSSAFCRGSGNIAIGTVGASGPTQAAPVSYTRMGSAVTPISTTDIQRLRVVAGATAYFILNQLEEKAYATPPVIVSGASASRGVANANLTGISGLLTYPFVAFVSGDMSAIDGIDRRLLYISDSSTANRVAISRSAAGSAQVFTSSGGVTSSSATFAGKTGARRLSVAVLVENGGFTAYCDGVAGSKITAPDPVGMDRVHVGSQLGSAFHFNSPILRYGVIPGGSASLAQALSTAA